MKSVLVFYAFNSHDIKGMGFAPIWDLVEAKEKGVVCRNVYELEMTANELADVVKNKTYSQDLSAAITDESNHGATYMFVMPVDGSPIYGEHI